MWVWGGLACSPSFQGCLCPTGVCLPWGGCPAWGGWAGGCVLWGCWKFGVRMEVSAVGACVLPRDSQREGKGSGGSGAAVGAAGHGFPGWGVSYPVSVSVAG